MRARPSPGAVTDRVRRDPRIARLAEPVLAAASRPLHGRPTPVLTGPGRGLRLTGSRHAAVWLLGIAERPVQAAFERLVRRGDTVLDVGASVGFFTLLAARLAGPDGRVVAFEPEPASRRELARNVALNGFTSVDVVGAAVSDATGTGVLHGAHAPTARLAGAHGLTVPTTTVDALAASPALVKVDVEGHECAVLDGMRGTLSDHRPAVIVEVHGTGAAVAARLRAAGYAVEALDTPGPPEAAPPGTHLLGTPPHVP